MGGTEGGGRRERRGNVQHAISYKENCNEIVLESLQKYLICGIHRFVTESCCVKELRHCRGVGWGGGDYQRSGKKFVSLIVSEAAR